MLNYDDLLFNENTIADVVTVFEKNKELKLVYGDDLLVDAKLRLIKLRDFSFHFFYKLLYYKSISQPSAFFTKEMYQEFGLNKTLEYSMDLELWLNIFSKHKTKYIDKILSKNRIHADRKMVAFEKDARIEARKLRYEFGANKNMFNVYKSFFKMLDIKNYFISMFYSGK